LPIWYCLTRRAWGGTALRDRMLRYLKVSNVAIIDHVDVEFHEGFNVLTGETGAGKSILIGALNLLLGGKVPGDIIRTGEEEALVEGLFDLPEGFSLPGNLDQSAVPGGELVLARRLFQSGRSRCLLNGNLVPQATLQAVGNSLVSIFGQHEHHALLHPEEHVEIVDRSGELSDKRSETARAFHEWKRRMRELEETRTRLAALEQLSRENSEAAAELAAAQLKTGEEQELVQEKEILGKAVQIRERAFEAHYELYGRSGSIMERFADIRKAVDFLVSVNPKLAGVRENLEEAMYRAEDVALELREVAEHAESDPARLEKIEERLALIRRLKRKYGTDLEGLLAHLKDLSQEAGEILDLRGRLRKAEEAVQAAREAYLRAARVLSQARREAAVALERSLKKELAELAMPEAEFFVSFQPLDEDQGAAMGLEKVEFLLASNPGEAARPLAHIASGGELSRIMLALKALQVDAASTGSVIFDEVDAGIGGHTALAVGSRLARVARRQQVLCVTHLHQIAALADHHLSVRKRVRQGRTMIEVTALDQEARVNELARMIGAPHCSDELKEHVRRLINPTTAEAQG